VSVTANALSRLAALDLPPKALAEVLSIFAEMQQADEDRKAKQRERTAKSRASRHGNVTVTLQSHDTSGSYSKEVSKIPLQEEERKKAKKERAPTKKHRLPDGWVASAELLAYARSRGLSDAQAAASMENLVLWARANAILKADWDATAQGFFRRDAEKYGCQPPKTGPPAGKPAWAPPGARTHDEIMAEIEARKHETPSDKTPSEANGAVRLVSDQGGGFHQDGEHGGRPGPVLCHPAGNVGVREVERLLRQTVRATAMGNARRRE
jgi:hypothetical protein